MNRRKIATGIVLMTILSCSPKGGQKENEITVMGWRPQDVPVWKEAEKRLNERGVDIQIKYDPITPTEYDNKLLSELQAGMGPDIYLTRRLPGVRTQAIIKGGYIQPLEESVDFSNFNQATLNSISTEGHIWGVPFANQILGIFYNIDIFDSLGLREPETWSELISLSETVAASGIAPFAVPGKDGWALALQNAMVGVAAPGEAFIEQVLYGEARFSDSQFVELNGRLNDLKQFYQKDYMAYNVDDMTAELAMEDAAMIFYGIWGVTNIKKLNPDIRVGFFPVPPLSEGDPLSVYVYMDGAYGLNSNTSKKELALELLRFTATNEFGEIFSGETGEMPALTGVAISEENILLAECYYYASYTAALYTYAVGSPFTEKSPSVYEVLQNGMQELYLDKITPKELAEKVESGLESWFVPFER